MDFYISNMILKQHLDNIIYFFYIKVYYIMSKLQAWRNSFRLVPDSSAPGQCKKGQTFRGTARNASVEFGSSSTNCTPLTGGTAKPGPTTQFDSELARRRKIQIRTRSNKVGNSSSTDKFERTFRGYNSHVENGRDGYTQGNRAQLFGHENNTVAQAGVGGDASDVIYFKPIFERFTIKVSQK